MNAIGKCDWLLSDEELESISNKEFDAMLDLTDSPWWSTALKVGLNLLPVGMIFIG